jgi:hypothetical protein
MTLKDLLKKKDKIGNEGATHEPVPQFTFMRTTTTTQEHIEPPSFPGDPKREQPLLSPEPLKKLGRFRRHSNAGQTSGPEDSGNYKGEKRLSERLHLGRSRSSSSVNVPENLPTIEVAVAKNEEDEAKWEKRATMLARGNTISRSGNTTPNTELPNPMSAEGRSRGKTIGDASGDVCGEILSEFPRRLTLSYRRTFRRLSGCTSLAVSADYQRPKSQ